MERIYIILLANILFFLKTLGYKYTSDDLPVWEESKKHTYGFWKRRYLQLTGAIRVTQQQDHFITMLIHALVCVFIYTAFGSNDVSFLASFLFMVNPINNQGSVWISGRGYALPPLLVLMTMTFPILAPLTVGALMYFNIGFVIANILPLWSMSLLPFVIIYGIWYTRKIKHDLKQKAEKEMFAEDKKIHWTKIILVIKTFSFYTIHALIPIKTTFYHSYMQSMAGSGKAKAYRLDRFFFLGLPIIAGFMWKICFTPWDLVSFGLVWWVVGLAPFLNAFRVSQEIAERYAYTPLVGLMLALAIVIQGHPMLIAGFIMMYATKLWFWMDSYQDDFYLVETSCINSPDAWFVWHVRALKRWDVQSNKEAMIMWTMAKMLSPNEFKVLFNLATMLQIHNNPAEALEFLNEAQRNIPEGQEEQSAHLIKEWKEGKCAVLI